MRNPDDWYVARFARELLVDVYEFMRTLPDSERRNYFDQIQRAATSVDNNFGDGAARQSDAALLPYLYHCNGSATELTRCLKACQRLAIGDTDLAKSCCCRSGRLQVMTRNFIRTVERDLANAENERRSRRRTK
jgi:four helix bundle protein